MKRVLVLSAALILVGIAAAWGQKPVISKLADGTTWITVHFHGEPVAFQVTPAMPSTGQFRTSLVRNLPPSDIVGAPQSIEIQILGDCQSKTYQIWGTLPYDGKMRAGAPEVELGTGPEDVTRRVEAKSFMDRLFHVVCKQ